VYAAGGSLLGLDFGDTATDTFTYTISDDEGVMDTATVTVTVTGEPTLETDEDTAINGYDAAVNAVKECAEAIAAISDGQITDVDLREVREAIAALSSLMLTLRRGVDR